jgi:drug/metabolite transporter (DMT)-like permease
MNNINKQENLAKLALIVAILVWSSAYVGIRFLVDEYTPGVLALFRYLIASVAIIPLYLYFKQPVKHGWKDISFAMFLGIFGFAIYNVCLNYGEQTTTAGIASFIIGLNPVFVILLACWIYNESINRYVQGGLVLSLIGLLLILMGDWSVGFNMGAIWVVGSAMTGGIYTLFQKRLLLRMNAMEFTAYAIWGGSLALLVYLPDMIPEIRKASFFATSLVIYMGIVPGVIGYFCWSYGFKHLTAAKAVSYSYFQPLISIVLAFILLQEMPTMLGLLGGLLALLGAIIVNKYSMKG